LKLRTGSHIYAGLKSGTTAGNLRESLDDGTIADHLVCISPKPGDAVFIPAGTVHTLGDDVVVFEVQQNSDVTFRLYDWGHIDPETKEPRPLQVIRLLPASSSERAIVAWSRPAWRLPHLLSARDSSIAMPFLLWRVIGQEPFTVGATAEPRVLVGIEGSGQIMHNGIPYAVGKGDVWLLPAEAGECAFQPSGEVTLLEIAIP
jgi:mannose-6-phosphate isomerase